MVAAAAIAAGAALGSSLLGNSSAKKAAKKQYKYQKRLQDDAQEFAKWQMGNAHQMEVEDLEKAGLNKILSANSGASAGVSAGSAQMAQTQAPDLNRALENKLSAKRLNKEIEQMDENIKNTEQATKTAKAQEELYKSEKDLNNQTERINEPDEETSKAMRWWNSTWAGKAINVAGDVIKKISPFTDGYTKVSNANSAKRISKSKKNK